MAAIWERISESCNYVLHDLSDTDLVNDGDRIKINLTNTGPPQPTAEDQAICKKRKEAFAQQWDIIDDRTRDYWPSPGVLATILISYLYFCKKAGPAWMKDRKPFDLTNVIFYYNVFQIFISTYLVYKGGILFFAEYDLKCQPVQYGNYPHLEAMHQLTWTYAVLKLIELLDTIFFVLRKKSRQISALHLYHHFAMPICAYIGLRYYPNGHSLSLGLINSFVHMIMYTYYLIAGLGPQYQKLLWWKRYVTILQLVQFFLIFIHNMVPLFNNCGYPKWINATLSISALHFVYMFGNFYYVNYIKTDSSTGSGAQKNGKDSNIIHKMD